MLTCNLMGGLGNQIFQIFTVISYAVKYRIPFKFLNIAKLGGGPNTTLRHTYWHTFFRNLEPFLMDSLPDNMTVIREAGFTHNVLPFPKIIPYNQDFLINGYFQSYKYFEQCYVTISKLIGLKKLQREVYDKVLVLNQNTELSNSDLTENSISMHFRQGDYKRVADFHPLLGYVYYLNALSYIKTRFSGIAFTVIYFCEEEDIVEIEKIVSFLSLNLPEYKFIRGEKELDDWEQLLYMSICKHNIIANSSFSYFGAYFNSNHDKVVCYPNKWFGPAANIDTKDLCPPSWVKIAAS